MSPGPRVPRPAGRKPTPKRRRGATGWRILGFLTLGVIAVGGLMAGKVLRGISGGPGGGGVTSVLDSLVNPRGKFPNKNRVNVLLVGKDYSYDRKGQILTKEWVVDEATGKKVARNIARSDTILLLSCDLENRKVAAMSIPRDTKVTAPDGKTGKINGTYSRGGAPLLRKTVAQLTGVYADYVVQIKPDAVSNLVNLLGGVDVETIDAMRYVDYQAKLDVNLPKGKQRIDGKQAVGFARFRKVDTILRNPDLSAVWVTTRSGKIAKDSQGNPIPRHKPKSEIVSSLEEGDDRRMARQQQLIRAMIAEGKKPSNWLRADKIINEALTQIETDFKRDQLFALAALFRGIQPDQIASASLVGEGTTRGMYFFIPDPIKTRAMVDWLIRGDEAAANRVTHVVVENRTHVTGAARRAAEMLRQKGGFDADFQAPPSADPAATAESPRTVIVYHKAVFQSRAAAVAGLLGGGTLVKEVAPDTTGVLRASAQRPDVTVRLGRDLAVTLGQRSASR